MNTVVKEVAIIYSDGKCFITKQSVKGNRYGWEFPTGSRKLGESPANVLCRVIKASYNMEVSVGDWLFSVEHKCSDDLQIMRCYVCFVTSDIKKLSTGDKFDWVSISDFENVQWTKTGEVIMEKVFYSRNMLKYCDRRRYHGDMNEYIFESTKTLRLMDRFEGRDADDKGPYKRFVLKNEYKATVGKYICTYHLIIERYGDIKHTEGNITLSEFKSKKVNGAPVYNYCNKQLREAIKKDKKVLKNKEFYFDIPYYLRAQNSGNREGYGWDWSYGVGSAIEGTYYGETDDYAFVGVVIDSCIPKLANGTDNTRDIGYRVELVYHKGAQYFKVYKNESESYLLLRSKYKCEAAAIKAVKDYFR